MDEVSTIIAIIAIIAVIAVIYMINNVNVKFIKKMILLRFHIALDPY